MSRDMRPTARKPTNATAMTIVTSEIGRRNANDTKFIGPPQPALPRAAERARLDGTKENQRDLSAKCGSYFRPTTPPSRPNDLKRQAELGRRTVWDGRGSARPDVTGDKVARSSHEGSN